MRHAYRSSHAATLRSKMAWTFDRNGEPSRGGMAGLQEDVTWWHLRLGGTASGGASAMESLKERLSAAGSVP